MESATWLLGVIAAATLVMAVVQVCVVVYMFRVSTRVTRLVDVIEREITPTIGRVGQVSAEAARVASLVTVQAERIDRLLATLAARADELIAVTHESVVGPVRQAGAFLVGLRAALLAFRRGERGSSTESASETAARTADQAVPMP